MGHRVRNADDAWAVFDQLRRNRQISFASEPPGIENLWRELTPSSQSGSNFWTDAYLAAFANATGYTLVTFDRGFSEQEHSARNTEHPDLTLLVAGADRICRTILLCFPVAGFSCPRSDWR
jgi:hypothetical protein